MSKSAAKQSKGRGSNTSGLKPFKPGQSGNPQGKNGWTTGANLVKDLCKAHSQDAVNELWAMAHDRGTRQQLRAQILTWFAEQAGGKPPAEIKAEVNGNLNGAWALNLGNPEGDGSAE